MGEQRSKDRPSARELRELQRINRSIGKLSNSLGVKSERVAESVCQELQQAGLIEEFWQISSHSTLDLWGIDLICRTVRGYFLLNVKKSLSGVRSFEQVREGLQRIDRQLFLIYPWRVTLEVGKRQEAKTELEIILSKDPSIIGYSLTGAHKTRINKSDLSPEEKITGEASCRGVSPHCSRQIK